MPSFDVVSEVDMQELRNVADQANRELRNRFDLEMWIRVLPCTKIMSCSKHRVIFQVQQMMAMAKDKVGQASVGCASLDFQELEVNLSKRGSALIFVKALPRSRLKKLVKLLKNKV